MYILIIIVFILFIFLFLSSRNEGKVMKYQGLPKCDGCDDTYYNVRLQIPKGMCDALLVMDVLDSISWLLTIDDDGFNNQATFRLAGASAFENPNLEILISWCIMGLVSPLTLIINGYDILTNKIVFSITQTFTQDLCYSVTSYPVTLPDIKIRKNGDCELPKAGQLYCTFYGDLKANSNVFFRICDMRIFGIPKPQCSSSMGQFQNICSYCKN